MKRESPRQLENSEHIHVHNPSILSLFPKVNVWESVLTPVEKQVKEFNSWFKYINSNLS